MRFQQRDHGRAVATVLDELDIRRRFDAGESSADLAAEVGLSRVQLWRRIGSPAHYKAVYPVEAPTALTIAWAAGFFDGEGNVGITADGHVRAGAAQVVAAPLHDLQRAFGGTVRGKITPNPLHRDQWFWSVGGVAAQSFLTAIRPYLRVKGPQADLAIDALMHHPPRRGKRVGDWERAERGSFYLAMLDLNGGRGRRSPNQYR